MFDQQRDQEALRQLAAEFKLRKPKVREPRRMAEAISQLLARRGYAQQRTIADQENAWVDVVGPDIGRQTRPGLIRRGVFEVFVVNSTLLQELTFRKRELVHKLAARLPGSKLRDLKLRIGPVTS